MNQTARHRFMIWGASLLIVAAAGLYATYLYDWLRGGAPARRPGAEAPTQDAALQKARREFRGQHLDGSAHLRLAEALVRSGRPVDAFYVRHWARRFFGEDVFSRTHALVVLYGGRHFLGDAVFDASPAGEARVKARLAADPRDPSALNYLAHIEQSRGRAAEALRALETGLAASPEDPGLLAYRAELAAAGGDSRGALTNWAKLAAAAPGSFEARGALEELGRRAGRGASGGEEAALAREALEELRRARPRDPLVFSTLAMALWQKGEPAAARALVSETLSKQPGHAGALMVEGALALADRDVEKAMRLFTQAWEKNPDDLYSAAKLAQLYYRARADAEAALPFYLALHRANPRYEDGEPVEQRIQEILDSRREAALRRVRPEALGRFLGCDDASLRAEAAVRAAAFKDLRWIESLADLLDDDTEIVRHNADYALFQIAKSHPDAVRVRREEWLNSDRPLVRVRALNLFADLDPQGAWPLVPRFLKDADPVVRFLTRALVLDHYYKDSREAAQVRAEYLAREKDPRVLALTAR
jgi:tetratricopeptide (TPR) repeat protein